MDKVQRKGIIVESSFPHKHKVNLRKKQESFLNGEFEVCGEV